MAVKSKRTKAAFPTTDEGEPDIYTMVNENEIGIRDAAEKAGITVAEAHRLLYKQEVDNDESLVISTKGPEEKLAAKLAKLRDEGVRWERLMVRSGLSKSKIQELVASHEGVEVEDLKRQPKAVEPVEESPAKSRAKNKRAQKAAEAELEDDDDEDDDEPVVAKPKRGRRKAAS